MDFAIVLVAIVAAVMVLREPIRRWPVAFYAVAVAAVVAIFAGVNGMLPVWVLRALVLLLQRGMVALALFAVVMYVGVLPRGSKLDAWLRPIRAELSILACILVLGHMFMYLLPYAKSALAGSLSSSVFASFIVVSVLFVLVVVLGVTSFKMVKQRMNAGVWKNVQRFAYPFFGLVYVHLMFMLAPAALHGGKQAIFSVVL